MPAPPVVPYRTKPLPNLPVAEEVLTARIESLERHVDQAMLELVGLQQPGSGPVNFKSAHSVVEAACQLGELKAELRLVHGKRVPRVKREIQLRELVADKVVPPSEQWRSICGPGYYFVDEDPVLGRF